MIQPGEIQTIAGKEGVRDTQIEKDYVIAWITFGIANNSYLKANLIFKRLSTHTPNLKMDIAFYAIHLEK